MSIDRAAFERLVEDNLGRLLGFAIRLCGEPDAAEDLVQEALLRASRSWRTFRGESSFQTWLMQIVVNVFRDRLKRRRQAEPLSDRLIDGRADDPVQVASARELEERVAFFVSRLPPRQRAVVVLVVYEKLTLTQAARWMGTTPQSARTNLHHARKKLRTQLEPYLRHVPDDP